MTSASALTEMMRMPDGSDKRNGNSNAIYAVIEDADVTHHMTIGMIDAWWENLAPSERAEIHERWVNAEQIAEAEQVEVLLAANRNPLNRIVQAAELLLERNGRVFVPHVPTFSRAESSLLHRSTRRRNTVHATQTMETLNV